jgi:hypothetical protein
MFSNIIKEFFIKKKLFNNPKTFLDKDNTQKIKSILLLIDESEKEYSQEFIREINTYSNQNFEINVLVYKAKIKNGSVINIPFFTSKNISFRGKFNGETLTSFMNSNYDLQINYFGNKTNLVSYVSNQTKAHFKVGFSSVDYRLNDLIIETKIDNTKEFIAELFKYLKVLNKI